MTTATANIAIDEIDAIEWPRHVERRPVRTRPEYRRPEYRATQYRSVRSVPAGRHPLVDKGARRHSMAVLVAAGMLTAVVVMGMFGLAHLRAPEHPATPVQTAVVQVQAGESLSDVAARVAPDRSVGAVVEQIRQLNDLESSAVAPGQTLLAPSSR